MWGRVRSWLHATMRRSRMEGEMDAELRFHIEAFAEDLVRSGVPRGEAQRRARIEFGSFERAKEECRKAHGANFIDSLVQDLRFGLRMLRKSPGFTVVAVLTLALGIGANTAIFSLLNAVVLRLLPVPDPQQLVQFTYTGIGDWNSYFDYPQLERLRMQAGMLSGIFGGVGVNQVNVVWRGSAGLAQCDAYTDNFFSVLGVAPQQGRLFAPGDDHEGADIVVLSDRYWRSRFAADPAIVGQTILIDQLPFTVVGITPPKFSIYVVVRVIFGCRCMRLTASLPIQIAGRLPSRAGCLLPAAFALAFRWSRHRRNST